MELCIPQFFEEAGLFVISRSTVQIRVLAPEKSRGYIKRCNPFLVTVRKTVRKLSARPFTGVAINSGHAGNSGNRVIGLASQSVMKNFEAEHFARDSEQIDHF